MLFSRVSNITIIMYVCVLLYYTIFTLRSDYDNSFDTPGFSLLKSLVMTSGEMEYEEVF